MARPDGLVLAAEHSLVLNSIGFANPVEEILAGVHLQLMCERGKAALGEDRRYCARSLRGLRTH